MHRQQLIIANLPIDQQIFNSNLSHPINYKLEFYFLIVHLSMKRTPESQQRPTNLKNYSFSDSDQELPSNRPSTHNSKLFKLYQQSHPPFLLHKPPLKSSRIHQTIPQKVYEQINSMSRYMPPKITDISFSDIPKKTSKHNKSIFINPPNFERKTDFQPPSRIRESGGNEGKDKIGVGKRYFNPIARLEEEENGGVIRESGKGSDKSLKMEIDNRLESRIATNFQNFVQTQHKNIIQQKLTSAITFSEFQFNQQPSFSPPALQSSIMTLISQSNHPQPNYSQPNYPIIFDSEIPDSYMTNQSSFKFTNPNVNNRIDYFNQKQQERYSRCGYCAEYFLVEDINNHLFECRFDGQEQFLNMKEREGCVNEICHLLPVEEKDRDSKKFGKQKQYFDEEEEKVQNYQNDKRIDNIIDSSECLSRNVEELSSRTPSFSEIKIKLSLVE